MEYMPGVSSVLAVSGMFVSLKDIEPKSLASKMVIVEQVPGLLQNFRTNVPCEMFVVAKLACIRFINSWGILLD